MMTQNLRLVPYARVSQMKGRTPELAERDYRERLEAWDREQPNVTSLPFVFDHDAMGGKLRGRRRLERVLEAIRAGEADGVVVPEAKRLGRNLRETVNLIHELRELGATFVPLDVPGAENPSDRNSKLALHLWLSIAEHELDGYEEQWLVRKTHWAEAGVHIGKAPLGYRHRPHPPGEDPLGLELDPETAPAVREAFALVLEEGPAAAARRLGLPPSKAIGTPEKPGILRNRVYVGQTSWTHPTRGPIVVEGTHAALLELPAWLRVQRVLDGAPTSRRGPAVKYPLSRAGLHCGRCDEELVGSKSDGRPCYRCGSAGGGQRPSCGPFANLHAGVLEARVRELLVGHVQALEDRLEEQYTAVLPPRLGGASELTDEDVHHDGPLPEHVARDAAMRELEELRAMPDKPWKAAAVRDQEDAVAKAQAALDAAEAEQEAASGWPEPWVVAQAPTSELPAIMDWLRLRVMVSPERGAVTERVRLERAD